MAGKSLTECSEQEAASGKKIRNKFKLKIKVKIMRIPKKGVGHFKHCLTKLFIGKRLLLSDDINLYCPRCKATMDKLIKNKIEIDICPYCNGMWLDDGEINKLMRLKDGKKTKK